MRTHPSPSPGLKKTSVGGILEAENFLQPHLEHWANNGHDTWLESHMGGVGQASF